MTIHDSDPRAYEFGPYICEMCGITYTNKYVSEWHTSAGAKYLCATCGDTLKDDKENTQ